MISYKVPAATINHLMQPGALDILTIIPIDDILTVGIPYVRSLCIETENQLVYDNFWGYFTNTWLGNYKPSWWNINSMIITDYQFQNRTNNPLESYNRVINMAFSTPHPPLAQFATIIKEQGI
jgi:hypothetical protein